MTATVPAASVVVPVPPEALRLAVPFITNSASAVLMFTKPLLIVRVVSKELVAAAGS